MQIGRDVATQAYLELLKAWFTNKTEARKAIFEHSETAGTYIYSHFANRHYREVGIANLKNPDFHRSNETLKGLRDHSSIDDSTEKREILAMVAHRKIRGIEPDDFHRKHIICFDHDTKIALEFYKNKAWQENGDMFPKDNIHLIDMQWDPARPRDSVHHLEKLVRNWAERHLNFKYHPEEKIFLGRWRTTRLSIPETQAHVLEMENQRVKRDIERRTGTHIICSDKRPGHLRLITIYRNNQENRKLVHEALYMAAREVALAW